jgi:hypothetical protein
MKNKLLIIILIATLFIIGGSYMAFGAKETGIVMLCYGVICFLLAPLIAEQL